ncbi:capsular polysaccharide biosynthesis protein [Tritonibacter horizontis]|uniref:Capsule polysaccharide biosynthesis protein n=1 Tax=Tritonibacter horizontis TaxID=1768241 RepID=A0A132BVJ8_9RHOB|nr:capsular polysaccharide biosynthesis protein [Tritonibacter horizontis]KUP92082.1 capsule polysaccharide biosynthesis protein [Tritonibacter horizontis]
MLRRPSPQADTTKPGSDRSRLFVYNGGFLTQKRVRRILELAGYDIRLGRPRSGDLIGIWGDSPTAHRGKAMAERHQAPLLRIEDAFLRSVYPGRAGEPPLGLLIDRTGVHFDPHLSSDLVTLLKTDPLDDSNLMRRARDAIARLQDAHLSKYNGFHPDAPVPEPGYVLVIDQLRGDASVKASIPFAGADQGRFQEMLAFAQEENPGAKVLIKTHPETARGHRPGYFSARDVSDRVALYDAPVSPHLLLDGAIAVYTVSSQMGFEAILAGHKPRVFGQPFYAGWGLTEDEFPPAGRNRKLTRAQLFAAAMILYPTWYDPYNDRLCALEQVIDALEAKVRAWREDRAGWAASEIRLWKRKPLQAFFGSRTAMSFTENAASAKKSGKNWMVWAGKATEDHAGAWNLEDGFLRSRGLGAELVPPLSLVLDRQGIYYDPTRQSDLDELIRDRATLTPQQERRVEALVMRLIKHEVTKYNLGGDLPELPKGHRILVPGQVEDDASIRLGAGKINTNMKLLQAVRAARPRSVVIYKPHPDVEAGLRKGKISATDALTWADVIAENANPAALIDSVDEVWTMTSLLGFEALLRRVPVTCVGLPFYAGWGLTQDRLQAPHWRDASPGILGLAHAALIDYPRYFDPISGLACPPEIAVERLVSGVLPRQGPALRSLAKLQGLFASAAHLWR